MPLRLRIRVRENLGGITVIPRCISSKNKLECFGAEIGEPPVVVGLLVAF